MIWTKQPIKTSIEEINDKVVSPTDLGSFASESDLISALNTKLNGMQNNEVSQIRFQMTSATASFKAYAYVGILTRITNQYASLNVTVCTSYAAALCVVGSKNTNWKFEELALKSDVTELSSKIATPPVVYTSYADVKSGITSKAASMASGSIASFDFHANYSTAEELPGGYYTCILRKYDDNSIVADIISNVGADYKLTYSGTNWRITSLNRKSASFSDVTLFDTLTTGFIGNVTLSGTAKANLSFSGSISFIVVSSDNYIHIICIRANGEIYTRNKNSGTWDESWKQIQFVT